MLEGESKKIHESHEFGEAVGLTVIKGQGEMEYVSKAYVAEDVSYTRMDSSSLAVTRRSSVR